MKSIG